MRRMTCILVVMFAVLAASCAPGSDDAGKKGIPYVDTGVDSEVWARVPAGEFLRDQHSIETMVDYDYEIMVTPVTNSQYAEYLNEALAAGDIKIVEDKIMGHYPGEPFDGHNHEFEVKAGDKMHIALNSPGLRIVYNGGRFSAIQGFENHPMVMVTWFGANAYCEFHGRRLPTEFEWEKAARGTDSRAYPWGNEIARNQANYYSSRHLLGKMFGESVPTTPVGYFNGRTYDGHETTEGKSPYGLYDMAGNVWEWTGDDYHDTHLRYMRGGSSANYEYNLTVWARNSAGPDHYGINIGFRCARDPQ